MNRFDILYLAATPFIAPGIAWKRMRHGKYRESLPGMLGKRLPARPLDAPKTERCWMHSVSVGETIAAGALLREFTRRELCWDYLCTTTTETGQAQARETMKDARHFSYAPADFSWMVRRFHRFYAPSMYLFFETEIWPNNLSECGRRGVPVFLVNGKLSERSAERYARFSSLFRGPLGAVTRFFMQTDADAARMARVIGAEDRIEVSGNVKFDALPAPLGADERAVIRREWGAGDDTVVILAGSTHPGEEEIVWNAYKDARSGHADALLVLAPRHPERFDAVAEGFRRWGARVHRASTGANPSPAATDVVLLDKMRVLARSYGAAEIALVAGSWAPIGGHNLLEAAVHGIPVLRGPHMHAQKEILRVLGPDKGAPEVRADRLGGELLRLCKDAEARQDLGKRAAEAALSSKGAAARVADRIQEEMKR